YDHVAIEFAGNNLARPPLWLQGLLRRGGWQAGGRSRRGGRGGHGRVCGRLARQPLQVRGEAGGSAYACDGLGEGALGAWGRLGGRLRGASGQGGPSPSRYASGFGSPAKPCTRISGGRWGVRGRRASVPPRRC